VYNGAHLYPEHVAKQRVVPLRQMKSAPGRCCNGSFRQRTKLDVVAAACSCQIELSLTEQGSLILLSACGEFLRRILSFPALGYLVIEGLSMICRPAKRDRLHHYFPMWNAIEEDPLWKALNLPRRQALIRLAIN
jgi:hypothetical protein